MAMLALTRATCHVLRVHWLGAAPMTKEHMQAALEEYRHNQTPEPVKKAFGDMLPATARLLQLFFEPFNAALAKFLKDDKFLYKDFGG